MSANRTWHWAVPATLVILLCQLGFCWKSLAHSLGGDIDFRVFYSSAHMVARGLGDRLYDYDMQAEIQREVVSQSGQTLPFLYPSFAALLFLPLSLFSYKNAFLLFSLANLCLLGIAGVWMRRHLSLLGRVPPWSPGCLFLGFFPVSIAIMQGQLSCILLLLYTLSFVLHKKHQRFSSGLFLAGTLIKFQFALPVVFLLLCWRQWRTIAGFSVGAIILTTVSIVVSGPHGASQYIHGLLNITREGLQNAQAARLHYGMFPGDMPNLHGFFFLITHGRLAGQALALLCSTGVMAWAARERPSLSVALPAAMIVSYHMQAYDLTLLLLPLTIEFARLSDERTFAVGDAHRRQSPRAKKASRVLSISLALLLVPAAPFILIKGMCGLFVVSVFGILWASTRRQADLANLAGPTPSQITVPQPC